MSGKSVKMSLEVTGVQNNLKYKCTSTIYPVLQIDRTFLIRIVKLLAPVSEQYSFLHEKSLVKVPINA